MKRGNEVKKADLHIHTTASDGLLSPAEVVQMAKQAGLAAIAITDHDTVAGITEAQEWAQKIQLEVVPGVEISTVEGQQEVHVLGYYIDEQDPKFASFLSAQRNVRQQRNQMMIEKLHSLGIQVTMEEVLRKKKNHTPQTNVGRPHIAEVLIDKGVVGSVQEAFEKYLGKDGLAYCTPPRITPFEAITRIREAGGVPVLAHPGLYRDDHLIKKLVDQGLTGLEVYHSDHTKEMERTYRELAHRYGLIVTGGSDFHGERNGSMYHGPIGTRTVEYNQLQMLKKARR